MANGLFLDQNGLMYLWEKIKKLVDEKTGNSITFDKIYPVGSIYMSVDETDPSILFGGKWERWSAGRVPVGVREADKDFDDAEKHGGEKEHTLTKEEIPSHSHEQYVTANPGSGSVNGRLDYGGDYTNMSIYAQGTTTGYTGGDKSHNNMPPYITCYMWKRIS